MNEGKTRRGFNRPGSLTGNAPKKNCGTGRQAFPIGKVTFEGQTVKLWEGILLLEIGILEMLIFEQTKKRHQTSTIPCCFCVNSHTNRLRIVRAVCLVCQVVPMLANS